MELSDKEMKHQIEAYIRFVRAESRTLADQFHSNLVAFEEKYGCRINVELLTPKMSKRIGKRIILHSLIGEISARRSIECMNVVDFSELPFIKSGI